MNKRTLGVASIVVVALLIVGAIVWVRVHPSQPLQNASQAPTIGKAVLGATAPEFQAATTDGPFDLATAKKPVFLEVFATWCPHCQRETAVLNKLYAAYKNRVAFVAVSGSDTGMDGASPASEVDVLNFRTRFQVQYPVAYDGTLAVANLYLQGGFPTIVVIDSHKKIAYLTSGETPYGELASQLNKVLP
ncbi:MAG TPA: TlpA disulfide reductase family protein [Candidatus Dormibacteraeota bacterium]|nr:TlpA disulfide reductase family protein [Candidatus Dormibacteraeota bacterium]